MTEKIKQQKEPQNETLFVVVQDIFCRSIKGKENFSFQFSRWDQYPVSRVQHLDN